MKKGLVLFWLILLFACSPQEKAFQGESPVTPSPSQGFPGTRVSQTRFTYREKGEVVWEVDAQKIQLDEIAQKGQVEGIEWNYYDKKGDLDIKVKAKIAQMDLKGKEIRFSENIKAVSELRKEEFTASELTWEGKKRILTGKGGIEYRKNGKFYFKAEQLKYLPDKKTLELKGKVEATLAL